MNKITSIHRWQERAYDTLRLEIQAVVGHLIRVLTMEFAYSLSVGEVLKH